ncbi:MAG: hypothetical protein IJA79_06820 [Desulfovibrio sp.]|nr:hypothetical protein [Desulfovibrio sp.]MBQ4567822.1 hypothetical protein [Desulfovibrio sp.]
MAVHWLDAWLWRRGIGHPVVRPLVRNEILLAGLSLLVGVLLLPQTNWMIWFGAGVTVMALTFWSLARFFLRRGLGEYSSALLWLVLLRWLARLALLAGLLYTGLVLCKAPPAAILGGVTAGAVTALGSFALASRRQP